MVASRQVVQLILVDISGNLLDGQAARPSPKQDEPRGLEVEEGEEEEGEGGGGNQRGTFVFRLFTTQRPTPPSSRIEAARACPRRGCAEPLARNVGGRRRAPLAHSRRPLIHLSGCFLLENSPRLLDGSFMTRAGRQVPGNGRPNQGSFAARGTDGCPGGHAVSARLPQNAPRRDLAGISNIFRGGETPLPCPRASLEWAP